jgi:hypothetical protein
MFWFVLTLMLAEGLALELGKVGLIQLGIELLREKKSGKQGEILQLALFFMCRLLLRGACVCVCVCHTVCV